VLAGDYFSGWYYYLLAELNDVELIGVLAEGIKEINELKIKLFVEGCRDFHEIIDVLEAIESTLLKKICTFFGEENNTIIFCKMFLLNRLLDEKKHLLSYGTSCVYECIEKIEQEKTQAYIDQKIEKLREIITLAIQQDNDLKYLYRNFID
jgi:heptaprenyl diphosphate synthase